jgi:hypothetical protein
VIDASVWTSSSSLVLFLEILFAPVEIIKKAQILPCSYQTGNLKISYLLDIKLYYLLYYFKILNEYYTVLPCTAINV